LGQLLTRLSRKAPSGKDLEKQQKRGGERVKSISRRPKEKRQNDNPEKTNPSGNNLASGFPQRKSAEEGTNSLREKEKTTVPQPSTNPTTPSTAVHTQQKQSPSRGKRQPKGYKVHV